MKNIILLTLIGILLSCSSSGTIEGLWNGINYSGRLKNESNIYLDFSTVPDASSSIEENLKKRNIYLTFDSNSRFQVKLIEEEFFEDKGEGNEACYSLTFGIYDSKVDLSGTYSPMVCSDTDNLFPTESQIKEKVYYRMAGIMVKALKKQMKKYPD